MADDDAPTPVELLRAAATALAPDAPSASDVRLARHLVAEALADLETVADRRRLGAERDRALGSTSDADLCAAIAAGRHDHDLAGLLTVLAAALPPAPTPEGDDPRARQ